MEAQLWNDYVKNGGNKKAERLDISDKTFGDVPMTGLEPALYR
jgi:hypothetical protein